MGLFVRAHVAAQAGQNEKVIELLSTFGDQRKTQFYYPDFLMGKALLQKVSPESSEFLKTYIEQHTGDAYIKAAYQKLAWHALVIRRDVDQYHHFIQLCGQHGSKRTGEDQQAHQAYKEQEVPNRQLLKARLLMDGGYYSLCEEHLTTVDVRVLKDKDQIEYYYRLGRLFQKTGETNDAIKNLRHALDIGQGYPRYYACNAALQLAQMYYSGGQYSMAKKYAARVLDINPQERKEDLHQQARTLLEMLDSN